MGFRGDDPGSSSIAVAYDESELGGDGGSDCGSEIISTDNGGVEGGSVLLSSDGV